MKDTERRELFSAREAGVFFLAEASSVFRLAGVFADARRSSIVASCLGVSCGGGLGVSFALGGVQVNFLAEETFFLADAGLGLRISLSTFLQKPGDADGRRMLDVIAGDIVADDDADDDDGARLK